MWNLFHLIQSTDDVIKFLAMCRLLHNQYCCQKCNVPCSLNAYADGIDGKRWYCKQCKQQKSIRHGSFFDRSHLTLQQIIIIMYCWAQTIPQKAIKHEV